MSAGRKKISGTSITLPCDRTELYDAMDEHLYDNAVLGGPAVIGQAAGGGVVARGHRQVRQVD